MRTQIWWHVRSKPGVVHQKRRPLLSSGSLSTFPRQRIHERNNRRTFGGCPYGGYIRRSKWEPSVWVYNWATLRDIKTGTYPSGLAESGIWDSKIWSRVPWDSDLRMTVLARPSNNCKRQTHPLVIGDITEGLWLQGFSWKKRFLVVILKGPVPRQTSASQR
jgi:hypothetical protein